MSNTPDARKVLVAYYQVFDAALPPARLRALRNGRIGAGVSRFGFFAGMARSGRNLFAVFLP
jgi:hypothetical protein